MTLRLVSNVTELPVGNLQDIGDMARRFADDVDHGEYGEVLRAVVVVQGDDGSLTILGWGENTNAYNLMGIFEAAKLNVFADNMADD